MTTTDLSAKRVGAFRSVWRNADCITRIDLVVLYLMMAVAGGMVAWTWTYEWCTGKDFPRLSRVQDQITVLEQEVNGLKELAKLQSAKER